MRVASGKGPQFGSRREKVKTSECFAPGHLTDRITVLAFESFQSKHSPFAFVFIVATASLIVVLSAYVRIEITEKNKLVLFGS